LGSMGLNVQGVIDAIVLMPAMLGATDCSLGVLTVSWSACSVVSAASGTVAVAVDLTSGSGISKSSKGEIPELVGDGSSLEILQCYCQRNEERWLIRRILGVNNHSKYSCY
jgi:hypothetical protein